MDCEDTMTVAQAIHRARRVQVAIGTPGLTLYASISKVEARRLMDPDYSCGELGIHFDAATGTAILTPIPDGDALVALL